MAGKDYKPNEICKFTYICYNKKCKNNEKEVVIKKKYKDQYKEESCKKCKEVMNNKGIISDENDIAFSHVSIAKIGSMTKTEKAAMLRKRATNHYKKHIVEKKREMIKTTDNNFRKSLNS